MGLKKSKPKPIRYDRFYNQAKSLESNQLNPFSPLALQFPEGKIIFADGAILDAGTTNFYTVPTGKRFFLVSWWFNSVGATFTNRALLQITVSGSTDTLINTGSNTTSNISFSMALPFDSGTIFSLVNASAGMQTHCVVIGLEV